MPSRPRRGGARRDGERNGDDGDDGRRGEASPRRYPRSAAAASVPGVYPAPAVKIFVIGAGQVGTTIVEALHGEHDVTVLDLDPARLAAISQRFDVATLEANGASRRALADAGVRDADLVLACTSRDEANLVAGTFARLEAPKATTVIRASNVEYIELWRQGQLDVDFVVSSEIETAHAIARVIGVSAARADRRLRRRPGAARRVRRHRRRERRDPRQAAARRASCRPTRASPRSSAASRWCSRAAAT